MQAGLGLEIQHDFSKAGFNSFDLPWVIDFRNWAHYRAVTLAVAQIFSKKSWEAGDCGKWQVLTSLFLLVSSECVCVGELLGREVRQNRLLNNTVSLQLWETWLSFI